MAANRKAKTATAVPLDIVGSTNFGPYPKVSVEQTINMLMITDSPQPFLIPTAGYQFQCSLQGNGRGIFPSKKASLIFACSQQNIYKIPTDLTPAFLFNINSSDGDVFIDEDIISNLAFCDKTNIYIYNYNTGINYIAGSTGYAVGTVSQSGNTVTGSGTTFTSSMVNGTIIFDDGTSATITAFTDATHITVNTSATKVSQGYIITTPLDFTPNYVCFHNARFIATSTTSNGKQVGQWRLSSVATSSTGKISRVYFPAGAVLAYFQGAFQTKPDLPIAVVRMPGRANIVLVMGSISGEFWTDMGYSLFPYVKNTSFNLDYGCVNPATIAYLGNMVVWVGQNERSGPVVMYTTGDDIKPVTTSGINYRLAEINYPEKSYGFAFKQNGHVLYVFTFYDPSDNLSLMYDFNTDKLYTLTDENMSYFIGKHAIYFNNSYYMNSINDGNIYELSSQFYNYQYSNATTSIKEIPRVRVCKTVRAPDGVPAILNNLTFPIEQGVDTAYTGQGNNIASINVENGGSTYTTATVIIDGDGIGGSATANIVNNSIFSVTLTDPGVNYSWAVATISGDGTGAQLSTILNVDSYNPRVDLSLSYDGGYTFSNFVGMEMNVEGKFKSRFTFYNCGYGNEFTPQIRFYGLSRFVATDGEMNFYK